MADDLKTERRLERQFSQIENAVPTPLGHTLRALRHPAARLIRIPLGVVFVLGGLFSFLPVLGIWMLPLGLLLLAVDIHLLRPPVTRVVTQIRQIIRQRRLAAHQRRALRDKEDVGRD